MLLLGFCTIPSTPTSSAIQRLAPALMMIAGLAVLAIAVWRWMEGKDRYRGPCSETERCARCGYNLTGNVSGRCPECGTPAERSALKSRERE